MIDEEGKGRESREEGRKIKGIERLKGEVKRIDVPGYVPLESGGTVVVSGEEERKCRT